MDSIDYMLEKYMGQVPGVAALAISNGEKVYNKQFGMANLEHNISLKSNTAFNIASIAKQFTAVGIMMLVEKGILSYGDSIVRYIPELGHYCRAVTLKNMLNNASGIENYYRILERLKIPSLGITNKDVLNVLADENRLLFPPGEKFDYSNSNWVLLAVIIERVTNLSYRDFLTEYIFKPLGMKSSYIFDEGQPIIPNRAYGYKMVDGSMCCDYYDALTTGDGGIFTTIEDLYLWDQALYTDKLISYENMELVFTPGKSNKGMDLEEDYGFGWSIGTYKGIKKLWHSGLDAGYRSLITRFPEKKISVVLLSNSSEFSWGERLKITNMFYDFLI
jgi:CubicO group peptidase (beta-lactamase class C family)